MSEQKQYKVYPKCINTKCQDGFIPVKVGTSLIMYELCPVCTIIAEPKIPAKPVESIKPEMHSWVTGEKVAKPSDMDYEAVDNCDFCSNRAIRGIMLHAAGATGRVCPVLFQCHECTKKCEDLK